MKYFSIIFLCFLSFSLTAQTNNDNLNEQLSEMKTAFENNDYSVIIDYSYPKLVNMMGGKEEMIKATTNSMKKMESQGFVIEELSFKDPSEFMEHNGDLQTTISQVILMQTPDGKVESTSTMVAISEDDGENWMFLSASGMSKKTVKSFYENIHPDLEIKKMEKKNL
jgi:hypothetical protein